ncbi:MAG: hypothetical protein WA324_06025 [Bryobacteraceae bacterium]
MLHLGEPLNEYVSRRDRWSQQKIARDAEFRSTGNWRLVLAAIILFLVWLVVGPRLIAPWWLLLPIIVFIWLAVRLNRSRHSKIRASRALRYYESGLARLDDRWAGAGNDGERFRSNDHVYANDLDVFGKGSLFELLSTTRTAPGDAVLARWLRAPSDPQELPGRQEAIRELTPNLTLREDLAILGEDVRASIDNELLERWGVAPAVAFPPTARALALVLALSTIATGLLFLAGVLRLWPFAAVLAVNLILGAIFRKRVDLVLSSVEATGPDLCLERYLVERIEREPFHSDALLHIQHRLRIDGLNPSRHLRRLERWIELVDSSEHMLIRSLGVLVLWKQQIAMGVENWRRQYGRYIAGWLDAVAEFEALQSLASLAYERPLWTLPEFAEGTQPIFTAEGLQHPLLPPSRCIANDVSVGGDDHRLLIVSGSNMSGKSTLLRAIGLNTVLAWAGAPVAAKSLRLSRLQTAASIRIVDSLQEGRSRFMAEILRIRQIVDLTDRSTPVLFLLDELLSGTNSHDRLIGATAVVKGLVQRGAIGLVTTHDLALAYMENDFGSHGANFHFDDQIVNGQIEFDYRLKPGVVEHSNALELMRAVGLPL